MEWKQGVDGEHLKYKDSAIHHEKELMSLDVINGVPHKRNAWSRLDACRKRNRQLAATRCVPTSHCAGDTSFVKKGEQTLFVNASWSKTDKLNKDGHTQWPWLVDIELSKRQGAVESAEADDAAGIQTSVIYHDGAEVGATEKSLAEIFPLTAEKVSPPQKTAEENTSVTMPPYGEARPSPDEHKRRAFYSFPGQARSMEDSSWRRTTAEVEQQAGENAGLETPPPPPPPPQRSLTIDNARPQGHRRQGPPGMTKVNEKYGFPGRGGRHTSGSWRRGSGNGGESDGSRDADAFPFGKLDSHQNTNFWDRDRGRGRSRDRDRGQ